MITVQELHKSYGTKRVLRGISYDFEAGKIYGIVGKNGACLLYTSPSPRDRTRSRMPSSA